MTLKQTPIPVSVELEDDGKRIVLSWPGGRVDEFAAAKLRFECSCAGCVDEMSGKRVLRKDQVSPDVYAVSYNRVGRYALQFFWSDGHSTGIYPYARLLGDG